MLKEDFVNRLKSTINQRNLVLVICIIQLIIILTLSLTIKSKNTNTILIPSTLRSEMKISTNGLVSENYIKSFVRDIFTTLHNITPNSINTSHEAFLTLVHPKIHGKLKESLSRQAEGIKKRRISTFFNIHNISFEPNNNLNVEVEGIKTTILAKKIIAEDKEKYQIGFVLESGLLNLINYEKINEE